MTAHDFVHAWRRAVDPATVVSQSATYTEVEQTLAEDMAIIPICHYANTFLLSADIKGWPYNNVENHWYGCRSRKMSDLHPSGWLGPG